MARTSASVISGIVARAASPLPTVSAATRDPRDLSAICGLCGLCAICGLCGLCGEPPPGYRRLYRTGSDCQRAALFLLTLGWTPPDNLAGSFTEFRWSCVL